MSRDFSLLMGHLRDKTAEVELDVPPAQSAGDAAAESRLARAQQAALRRGDRVARVYKLVNGKRAAASNGSEQRSSMSTNVTENECRTLIAAGATWVGPKEYTPASRPYIERIRIENFRCIRAVEFPLTPLHALIGPNDSGKSTLLEAFVELAGSTSGSGGTITALANRRAVSRDSLRGFFEHSPELDARTALEQQKVTPPHGAITSLLGPVRILRLDPDAMREPTNLIPQGSPLEYTPRGAGLAAVYDALLSRRIEVFLEINKRFTTLFPTVQAIQLTNPSTTTKALGIELRDGRTIGPGQLSEGMLYWLAFAALPHLQPAPLILIEEPENGLHPSRIADVMRVLRDISNTSQIILATHHPLVINELQSDEVTIITRTPEQGTIATPLASTKNFEQRSKVYALGELWLNYADGNLESDLVGESTLPSAAG